MNSLLQWGIYAQLWNHQSAGFLGSISGKTACLLLTISFIIGYINLDQR